MAGKGIMKPLDLSPALKAFMGKSKASRADAIKAIWAHIKKYDLQDAKNRRLVHADDALMPIFGKSKVTMFEIAKLLNKHVS